MVFWSAQREVNKANTTLSGPQSWTSFSFCVPSLGQGGYNISLLDTEIQHMVSVEFKDKQQREKRKTKQKLKIVSGLAMPFKSEWPPGLSKIRIATGLILTSNLAHSITFNFPDLGS